MFKTKVDVYPLYIKELHIILLDYNSEWSPSKFCEQTGTKRRTTLCR